MRYPQVGSTLANRISILQNTCQFRKDRLLVLPAVAQDLDSESAKLDLGLGGRLAGKDQNSVRRFLDQCAMEHDLANRLIDAGRTLVRLDLEYMSDIRLPIFDVEVDVPITASCEAH